MNKDYPLTKQQLGLWIEQQLHPSNTSYNTCVKVRLSGRLDEERFRKATQQVINFFDTLKVYFIEKNGVPFQRIEQDQEYYPELIDISEGLTKETTEKANQAKKILSDKLNTAIDLTQFPIMRASLIKTASETYYFIGMVPHIVSDGRAAILYLESLSVAYNHGEKGLIETYGKTKKNWDDFSEDDLFEMDEETKNLNKQHWQKRLENASHYFDYSYGKKLVDPDDRRGERVYFDLSEEIAKQLKAHCKANRTTLFNVFVCAFSIFIHKYYRLRDLLIGYPVNVRPVGYKHFFGFFVNILPIRVDLRDDPTYSELLKRVHQTRKEDKRFQKYPALDIVADIRDKLPDFDGRVFNLSMAQTVSRLFDLELDGIESQPLDTEYYDVNDDFSLSYELIEQRIGLWFEYRKALFDRDFINQAMQHIERIIIKLLDNPETRIADFELLTKEEQKTILSKSTSEVCLGVQQNSTKQAQSKSIHSLFETQVQDSPDNIAIIDGENSYTYAELNETANQLARHIQSKIAGKQQAIAVSLNNSIYLIVSLLAILKASCFYIPIPIAYPEKRKQFILKDANVKLLLSKSSSKANELSWATSTNRELQVIDLTKSSEILTNYSKDNLNLDFEANDHSYIIYTSGSTGLPKGVILNHSHVVPKLEWLKKYFGLNREDAILQNTDFSFDVSVAEIFWPLLSGAKLVLSKQEASVDIDYLLELISSHKITTSCLVPSLLRVLINNDQDCQLSSLKNVLSAGEALPELLRNEFYSNASTKMATLYNFYGPTEAAIYASYEKVSRDKDVSISIGKALAGTSLLVLDEKQELVPTGVVGELYIGGDSIALGYQSNEALTSQVFIQDPFSKDENARLYSTGDLVRNTIDGRLEYIGRCDQQIKIRGFRVELGEIEAIVSKCSGVKDIALSEYQSVNTTNQLVAYLVKDIDSKLNEHDLIVKVKEIILNNLPHYMMPSLFSFICRIPRLPSGKLNKSKLPDPQSNIAAAVKFTSANTDVEKKIVNIWAAILSMTASKISTSESFFDLGGDSLMAIQFVSLAEKEGLFFDMGDLFVLRSIKELARAVKKSKEKIFVQEEITGSYPLLPRQAKFFSDDFSNPDHWNRTFSFDLMEPLETIVFKNAIKTVLEKHDNLRVQFSQLASGEWQQECVLMADLEPELDCIFNSYDIKALTESEQRLSMQEKTNQLHKQIRLSESPLIRIGYFETSENVGKMVILFHHLLVDMVSSRLIFEDLMLAYVGEKSCQNPGQKVTLAPKTTSIKDWVLNLHKNAKKDDFFSSIEYWKTLPSSAKPTLPLDFNVANENYTKANSEGNVKLNSFVINAELTKKLLIDLPKDRGMPIQDFLLASFFEVIASWTGENSITVSTCGHGREVDSKDVDLSRTVGWVNTVYPVYLTMDNDVDLSELTADNYLSQVKQQLSKIPKNNIDYNILRYLVKHKDILFHSNPSLFFNYVGQIDAIIPDGIPFVPTSELPGVAGIADENHLCYQLYFEVGIVEGQLTFRVTYSDQLFKQITIKKLSDDLVRVIKKRVSQLGY